MYLITRSYMIEAAHRLTGVPPTHKCFRLHGHNYRVVLELTGPVDPATGFVVDFWDVDRAFQPIFDAMDHRLLNDIDGLENPTAEHIAAWIAAHLRPLLPELSGVQVHENPDCCAIFRCDVP